MPTLQITRLFTVILSGRYHHTGISKLQVQILFDLFRCLCIKTISQEELWYNRFSEYIIYNRYVLLQYRSFQTGTALPSASPPMITGECSSAGSYKSCSFLWLPTKVFLSSREANRMILITFAFTSPVFKLSGQLKIWST